MKYTNVLHWTFWLLSILSRKRLGDLLVTSLIPDLLVTSPIPLAAPRPNDQRTLMLFFRRLAWTLLGLLSKNVLQVCRIW